MKLGTTDISAIKLGSTGINKAYLGSSVVYEPQEDYKNMPLFIENEYDGENTITFSSCIYKVYYNSGYKYTYFRYSKDNVNYTSAYVKSKGDGYGGYNNVENVTVTLTKGERLYVTIDYYNNASYLSGTIYSGSTADRCGGFSINSTQDISVGGNLMSLTEIKTKNFSTNLNCNNPTNSFKFGFSFLFYNCTKLIDSSRLVFPETFTTFTSRSSFTPYFKYMFYNCNRMTKTVKRLPVSVLDVNCYNGMFYNCTSLTTAPELPATTLANNCYSNMFSGCTSLNSIKCMAEDISAADSTTNWVYNVAATGTFTTPSTTSWSTGTSGIPSGWTRVDT